MTGNEEGNNCIIKTDSIWTLLIPGGAVFFAGLLFMAGWYLKLPELIRLSPAFPAVAFNGALMLTVSGVGMVAYGCRFSRLAMVCGGIITITGFLTLIQHLLGIEMHIDQLLIEDRLASRAPYPGRMATSGALAFIFVGLALLLPGAPARHRQQYLFWGIIGGSLVALALVSPTAYLIGGDLTVASWNRIVGHGMSFQLSLGFFVIGAGFLVFAWLRDRDTEIAVPSWFPVMMGIAVLACVLTIWQTLREREFLNAENIVKSQARDMADDVRIHLDKYVKRLLPMARRWEARGNMPRSEWESDIRIYQQYNPGFKAIEWIDPHFRARWAVPPTEAARMDPSEDESKTLLAAAQRRELRVTRETTTDGTATGRLLVYVPFANKSRFAGFIRGVLDAQELLDAVMHLKFRPGYAIAIFDGDRRIYRRGDDGNDPSAPWAHDVNLEMYGISLRVRVWPVSAPVTTMLRTRVPEIALGLGTLLSLILALTAYFAQKSWRQARLLQKTNLSLSKEIAGHRQALDELERSERRYRGLLEHAADAIFIADSSGKVLEANRSACDMSGYSYEELLRMSARDLFSPEELAARPMRFPEVLAGRTVVMERPLLRGDGTTLPVEVSVKLIGDRLQAIMRDISERKRAEALTTRLGRMLDCSSNEIYVLDASTFRFVMVNQGALNSLGYSSDELIRMRILDIQPEFTEEAFAALVRPMLGGCKKRVVYEALQRRKDGSPYPVEVRIQLSCDEQTPLYIAVADDISARREAELQMRKLSGALEQTADAVLITDTSGVIEYVNPAFEKATGYSLDELRGRTPRLLKSGRHDEEFYRRLWSTLQSGGVFRDIFTNRRKDGSLYCEEATISPLRDAHDRITHFISTRKNIAEHQYLQERLLYHAQHDMLTQLPNRALFMGRLDRAVSRARWSRELLAVLSLDIDDLGVVNGTLGHEVGDRLLQLLAERAGECLRDRDTIARLGGDEFGIILESASSLHGLSSVIQKIRMALALPYTVDGQEISVTVTIGVSLFPEDGEDAPTLAANAATTISRVREQGKSNFGFYRADLNAKMTERLDFDTDLRRALERREFFLHYQPQLDLRTNKICGMEALLRWQHPQRGVLMPRDFLPSLEETGLIVPLGAWLLRTACEQNSLWQATGLQAVPIAVNISYQQLGDPDYADLLALILEETRLAPRYLQLDVGDRVLSREAQITQRTLKTLSSMGVTLVADDFIIGDSSLKYLKRLPVNGLKIDAAPLLHESDDAEETVMTRAIVSIAHKMRLQVMADGVETERQLHLLQEAGCDIAQGGILSAPLTVMEATRLLQGGKFVRS